MCYAVSPCGVVFSFMALQVVRSFYIGLPGGGLAEFQGFSNFFQLAPYLAVASKQ